MSTEVAKPEAVGHLTLPVTGEAIDLAKPEDVVRAGHTLKEMAAQIRAAKTRVDEAARVHLRNGALRVMSYGRYQASESTGKAEYNADAIYEKAIELGVPQDAVEKMIPLVRRVKDGRELSALASRDDLWRQAMAAGTTRKPGSMSYDLQGEGAPTPAPATPVAIQQHVAAEKRADDEAEELGI